MGSVIDADEIRASCRGILENEDGSAETICRGYMVAVVGVPRFPHCYWLGGFGSPLN